MKRLSLLVLCVLAFTVFGSVALAQDSGDARAMAQYFPAKDVVAFMSLDLREGNVDTLLDLMDKSISQPSVQAIYQEMGLPYANMRDFVNMALQDAELNVSLDELLGWFGDYAAVSLWVAEDDSEDPAGYFLFQVVDRAGLEAKLKALAPNIETRIEGDFTHFDADDTGIALSDEWLVLFDAKSGMPALPTGGDTLATSATFQSAMAALPAESYGVAVYLNLAAAPMDNTLEEAEQVLGKIGPMVIGGNLVDDSNLILDLAFVPAEAGEPLQAPSINTAFLKHVPVDTMAVIQAHDLSNAFTSILGLIQRGMDASGGGEDITTTANQAGMFLGLNLQDDLLSWAHGDYSLFADLDWAPIMAAISDGSQPNLDGAINFGLLIEATDAEKAATLAKKLGHSLAIMLMSQEQAGMTAKEETVDGKPLTTLHLESSDVTAFASGFAMDILIGATDEVFFIATAPVVEHIRSGAAGMDSDSRLQAALAYTLPNPTSLWYLSNDALAVGSAMSLGTMLGLSSAMEDVAAFDGVGSSPAGQPAAMSFGGKPQPLNQPAAVEATATPLPEPTAAPVSSGVDINSPAFVQQWINEQLAMYHSATISTAVRADGVVLLRFVNSLVK